MHILPLNSPKMFGTLEGIFFVKYTTMLYQWQLVKNKVIQSNCIFLAPVLKLNSSMDYLPF